MNSRPEFNNIRPFLDSEVPEAIETLINNKDFEKIEPFLFSGKNHDEKIKLLRKIKTIEEFQKNYSNPFLEYVINESSDGLTVSGIEEIKGKGHLYIANHRDIILDTAFMQLLLQRNNIPTTEITVGDNLMKNDLFKVLGKLNRVFTLKREGSRIEMYNNFILHAQYINNVIRERNESLWIAQRDGRTKDGNDKTQQGLLKMILGDRRDIEAALHELAIVPVAISYELEPCFKSKIRETYITKTTGKYIKSQNEDMNSVATSTIAPKGRIHIGFGKRLNTILNKFDNNTLTNNEIINSFIDEIDYQIYDNYKLWPYNYLAYDILKKANEYSQEYTNEDKETFSNYVNNTILEIDGEKEILKEIAYQIYANPVINKRNKINNKKNKSPLL